MTNENNSGAQQNPADTPADDGGERLQTNAPSTSRINGMPPGELAEALALAVRNIPGQIASFQEAWNAKVTLLAAAFKNFAPVVVEIAKALEGLPAAMRAGVSAAAFEGWFYDPDVEFARMTQAWHAFASGDRALGDQLMADYFRSRLDEIEAALKAAMPRRERFVAQAFAAHMRGEFALAIPLLLAQADGASKELRDGHFFLTNRKTQTRETAAYGRARSSGEMGGAAMLALIERLPIMTQMDKVDQLPDPKTLNRHMVMHGSSLDYDSETNSLKTISLLNYVVLGLGAEPPASDQASAA